MRAFRERPTGRQVGRPTRALIALALGAITVIDGDTVEEAGTRWRLTGIDAPEIHRARCPAERQRGILGAARLISLIGERGATLVPDVNGRGTILRDKHGRTLGALVFGDGTRWPDIAITEGHAVAWDGRGKAPGWCGTGEG